MECDGPGCPALEQPLPTFHNAGDLPMIVFDGFDDDCAYDRIQSWGIASRRQYAYMFGFQFGPVSRPSQLPAKRPSMPCEPSKSSRRAQYLFGRECAGKSCVIGRSRLWGRRNCPDLLPE